MSQLGDLLQETVCSQETDLNINNNSRRRSSTLMGLLRKRLEAAAVVRIRTSNNNNNDGQRPRKRFKLLKGFSCCRATSWGHGEDTPEEEVGEGGGREGAVAEEAASPGMNLAAALAAERHWRDGIDVSPMRVSLMRLLEETALFDNDNDDNNNNYYNNYNYNSDSERVCCVCMGREKGAALIPCGHTFCRVCSRELWLNRRSCPLCNRSILDILDIF